MDVNEHPSADQYLASLDRMERLISAFFDSQQFERLTRHQQREAQFVIEPFHKILYQYEYVPLDDPDDASLEVVCHQIYPGTVSAELDHFETVAPVIAGFLRFLDQRGDLKNGDAHLSRTTREGKRPSTGPGVS